MFQSALAGNYPVLRSGAFIVKFIFFVALFLSSVCPASGQQKPVTLPTRILFLFDGSQSMYARWQSDTRISIAKNLLNEIVDSLKNSENVELALRVYGHQKPFPPQDCDDTKLEVAFGKNNHEKIKARLNAIVPRGTTPIARALEECSKDFPSSPARNIIILITDGIEECNGDPCAVSLALQKKGIVLKPFVIGLGLDDKFLKTFECVGNYYDAASENQFRVALNVVISQALNSTTCQVNLLDARSRPTETNVNMTFYDMHSGEMKYNFIHTINHRAVPDTLRIDPLPTYRVVVHTLPPVSKDSVKLVPGKHTIIPIDAPQGSLLLKYDGISEYRKLNAIVRKHKDPATLHVQEFNTAEKYLLGRYDLEVLSIPRIMISDVDIAQSHTTTIQIPQPGLITILMNSAGYGSLFVEEKNKLNWALNLDENNTRQTIALQPGNYRVVYRPKNSKESTYTIERAFQIKSGSSQSVTLY